MRKALTLTALLAAAPALADPQVISQVRELAVTGPFESIPAAPAQEGDACTHRFIEAPETAVGRAVRAAGWNLTSETPFGDLTAVGFVASSAMFTSGMCELYDGNIGIFSGTKMIALVYSPGMSLPVVGYATPFGDNGLRIFSGDIVAAPVADITRIGSTGIAVTPPALQEAACNGAGTLPYLYGLPIDLARNLLIEQGWQPVPGDPEAQKTGQASSLAAAGITEVEDCSGTGLGFCHYAYSAPAGTLGVNTAGEISDIGTLPGVSSYGVDCH